MKKILGIVMAMLISVGLLVGTAQPASAYTTKENKVWAWVKRNAPEAAKVMGKKDTVQTAKLTCRVLNNGYDIYDVMDIQLESSAGLTGYAYEMYEDYTAATTVAAIWYLCPRHRWQLDEL